MKKLVVTCVLALCACKKPRGEVDPPPPIRTGKCVVDRYDGTRIAKQACVHGGYVWNCVYDALGSSYTCDRSAEASGERVVSPPPLSPADAAIDVIDTIDATDAIDAR